jgi:hypothetical protein
MELKRIKALGRITALKHHAIQIEMAALLARERALRRNLADLASERKATSEVERSADDPARVAGAEVRWQVWVDQRRATINAELAQVLAQKADCTARLRLAFGKDQVAQALVYRAR